MADHTTETLPNGDILVRLGTVCGTVSSWHLVPGMVAQLRRLLEVRRG